MTAPVVGRGRIAHHFHGDYSAACAIIFDSHAEAMAAFPRLVGFDLGQWVVEVHLHFADSLEAQPEGLDLYTLDRRSTGRDRTYGRGFTHSPNPRQPQIGEIEARVEMTRILRVLLEQGITCDSGGRGVRVVEPNYLIWHGDSVVLGEVVALLRTFGAEGPIAGLETGVDHGTPFEVRVPRT